MIQQLNDFSSNAGDFKLALIKESNGDYLEFLSSLKPRYWRVWLDICGGYFATIAILFLSGHFESTPAVVVVLVGAILFGLAVQFLQLFIHEGAHFGLASNRRLNDVLCDFLISWQVGTTIKAYRAVHLAHHRMLGKREDSEISYTNRLSLGFILRALFGVHALNTAFQHGRESQRSQHSTSALWSHLGGALVHFLLLLLTYEWLGISAVLVYVFGMGVFFPFFASLRQLLEHRPETGYTPDEGSDAVTRNFEPGVISAILGGAGFSKHLLHHWEPGLSYTNLAELEQHLKRTSVAAKILDVRQASYFRTFKHLWNV